MIRPRTEVSHGRWQRAENLLAPLGRGVVEEEAQIVTPYHRPTLQLLKFTDGEAAGGYESRFCFYDHSGRFQRSP